MSRRTIYVSGRPAPRHMAPAPTYTWEQRLTVWWRQLFAAAVIITMAVLAVTLWPGDNVYGSIDAQMRTGFVTSIRGVAECAASMEYAHPEDELCTTWLEGPDQRVVFGPLWAKP